MATRPPDFKASGVRTERIIASGSLNNPRLLIIGSGSTNSDGVNVNTDTIKLSGTGSDTWLFISGSRGGSDRVAFGGDTYFSGSIFGSDLVVSSSTITVGLSASTGYSDTYFYVTGTAGSKNSLIKGTSIFAGDLVVSGDIYNSAGVIYTPGSSTPGGSPGSVQTNDGSGGFDGFGGFTYDDPTLTLSVYNVDATSLTGSLTTLNDGSPYLLAGTNVTLSTGSNGAVTIASAGGGSSNWNELSPSPRLNTTASVSVAGDLGTSYAAENRGSDVFFFVSGTRGGTPASTKKSVFGGDVVVTGSTYFGTSNADTFVMNSSLGSSIVPTTDRAYDLGSPTLRFANMYTGDLHLKNDRGDWTVIEEPDFLSITNNRTGKRFKILMEPID
jgi:hypothetical protein